MAGGRGDKLFDRLQDAIQRGMEEKAKKSWCFQSREERKRRLRAVMTLSAELEKIKTVSIFSVGLGEQAIEAIIEGNWKVTSEYATLLSFEDGRLAPVDLDTTTAMRGLWKGFVHILRTTCTEA